MGKIISIINTTPDGFADAQYAIPDADYYQFTQSIISGMDTLVFGRCTFELFQNLWTARLANENTPDAQMKMARVLNDKPKVVFSTTLKTTTWNNSTIIQKVDIDYFDSFRQEGKKGLLTVGSLDLVSALTKLDLIDEYYFCIQPMIAGKGDIRLFDKLTLETMKPLKYLDSKQLESGVQIIHYEHIN